MTKPRPRRVRPQDPDGLARVAAEEAANLPPPPPPPAQTAPPPAPVAEETAEVPPAPPPPASFPTTPGDDISACIRGCLTALQWIRASPEHPMRASPERRAEMLATAQKIGRVAESRMPAGFPALRTGVFVGAIVCDLLREFWFTDDLDEIWTNHVRGTDVARRTAPGAAQAGSDQAPAREQTVDVAQMGGSAAS